MLFLQIDLVVAEAMNIIAFRFPTRVGSRVPAICVEFSMPMLHTAR